MNKASMERTVPLLIQVLAQLKPTRCGVSDQAVLLAGELKAAFGVDTAFVVLNSEERSDLLCPSIYCKPAQLLESCLAHSADRPASLLVHVSGYGYSPDGAPTALAEALAQVKADGRFGIAAYFHELVATGPPWKSAFWYARRQKNAVRNIARLCELLATNTSRHARWLEREIANPSAASIQVLPVLSAAGEAKSPVPIAQREASMAVFGLPVSRKRSYRDLAEHPEILAGLGIEKIIDVGTDSNVPAQVNGIPVSRKGRLDEVELAAVLSRSRCGFLSYPPDYLAKSSIFAAYCAQGTVSVIPRSFTGEIDGLSDGVHLLSAHTAKSVQVSELDRCSTAAWHWYSAHGIHVHAATYAGWLKQPDLQRDRVEAAI
jgi:hypothetical protein